MARREYKFLAPVAQLAELRALILPHVQVDPYAVSRPGNQYTVRSLYLDTGNLDCYREKLAGVRNRLKIRIRGYNDIGKETPVFLELKQKSGSAVTKRRSQLQHQCLTEFFNTGDVERFIRSSNHNGEARENVRRFLFNYHSRALAPVIAVVYEREPYFSRLDAGVRVTLDKDIRAYPATTFQALGSDESGQIAMPGHFVLEIKTDLAVPLWLQMILSRLDKHHESVSKYAICIDSLAAIRDRFQPANALTIQNRHAFFQSRE